jgi:aminoglycoside phosphotransferase (APT) family kinase protein
MIRSNYTQFRKKIFFSKTDIPLHLANTRQKSLRINNTHVIRIMQHFLHKKVTSIERLHRSSFHSVFKVTADKKFILRINNLSNLFKETSFLVEAQVAKILVDNKLPVAQIVYTDLSRSIVPLDYQICEVAQGSTLYDQSKRHALSNKTLHIFGATLARIHKIKTTGFGPISVRATKTGKLCGIHTRWRNYILCNIDLHIKKCLEIKAITKKDAIAIQAYFMNKRKILDTAPSVILHGDVANHNVIVHHHKITAFIDWEDCLSGDPIFDVAYYATGAYKHTEWLKSFLDGYFSTSTQTHDFWERYWLYFLRIALSKTVLRHMSPPGNTKELPNTFERVRYALQHTLLH